MPSRMKIYSDEAADVLREALEYHESLSATSTAAAATNYAPTGVVFGVLGTRGGSSAGGGKTSNSSGGANGENGNTGGDVGMQERRATATSAAFSSDDERGTASSPERRRKEGGGDDDDSWASSSDSSFSGGSEGKDEFGGSDKNVGGGGAGSAGMQAASAAAGMQALCLTDPEYDASASSAGEMSEAAVLGAGAGAGGALPPHRRLRPTIGSSKASARRDRERSNRRVASRGHGGDGHVSEEVPTEPNLTHAARSLGMPPSILIPLPPAAATVSSFADDEEAESSATAAQQQAKAPQRVVTVPSALLPPGNVSWDPPIACRTCLRLRDDLVLHHRPVVVLLLRSGRFAGGVFQSSRCLAHKACARYTVRRGQGGSQSTNDNNKGKAKSMGAQLRRAGEQSLREDVAATLSEWRSHVADAALVLLSCPKTMRKGLHEEGETASFLPRDDERIRRVPLDVGRPTFEAVQAVYEVMMTVVVRPISEQERLGMERGPATASYDLSTEAEAEVDVKSGIKKAAASEATSKEKPKPPKAIVPLTSLHEAVIAGDIDHLMDLLAIAEAADAAAEDADQIDARAGEDLQTPLHYAAALDDREVAARIVTALLVEGGANPCVVDGRNRVPYFMAGNEKVRDAFRSARATLGEDHCDWDGGAKVPSPLTQDDVQKKKDKAAEKKRRQRARQKEKKAADRAAEEARIQKEKREAEAKKKEEDAKRIRAGLQPKTTTAVNACDYCQKVCKGKSRSQMFSRLEYVYCSTDCVRQHQRELTAAAAMARFG